MANNILKTVIFTKAIMLITNLMEKAHIIGLVVLSIADSSDRAKEMGMVYGNQAGRIATFTRDNTNKIRKTEKAYTSGKMGQFIKEISNKI